MEECSIRSATVDDAGAIRAVARESWHAAYDDVLGADRVEETVDAWYDPARLVEDDIERPERPLFVATVDGDVVGFVEAVPGDDDLAHLYRIYVAPDHWGQGIGGSLLDHLEAELDDRGFDSLQLTVMAENEVGVKFYESRGFRRTGTSYDDQLDIRRHEYRTDL